MYSYWWYLFYQDHFYQMTFWRHKLQKFLQVKSQATSYNIALDALYRTLEMRGKWWFQTNCILDQLIHFCTAPPPHTVQIYFGFLFGCWIRVLLWGGGRVMQLQTHKHPHLTPNTYTSRPSNRKVMRLKPYVVVCTQNSGESNIQQKCTHSLTLFLSLSLSKHSTEWIDR